MIWNIKKANSRISELETELKQAKEQDSSAAIGEAEATITALQEELEKTKADFDKTKGELSAKDAKITELQAAIEKSKTDFEAKEAALAVKETEFSARVETAASTKARLIMAELGVPATTVPGATTTANTFDAKVAEYMKANPGKSKAEAVNFCVKAHTKEYSEWLKSGNTSKL